MRADAMRNEAAFLPVTVEDLTIVRRAVIEAGYPAQIANGLVGWLVSKAAGERDVTSSRTRSKYRKILTEPAIIRALTSGAAIVATMAA